MINKSEVEFKEFIGKILDESEKRIRATMLADAGDLEQLQSGWQERDSAAERNLREVEWNQFSALNLELSEVEAARKRLADGTFGVCEDCSGEIPAPRLAAVPTARKCIGCQELTERESGERSSSL